MHCCESVFHVASELSVLYPDTQYLKLKTWCFRSCKVTSDPKAVFSKGLAICPDFHQTPGRLDKWASVDAAFGRLDACYLFSPPANILLIRFESEVKWFILAEQWVSLVNPYSTSIPIHLREKENRKWEMVLVAHVFFMFVSLWPLSLKILRLSLSRWIWDIHVN